MAETESLVDVMDIGTPSDVPLVAVPARMRAGGFSSTRVYFAAARVAGATEKRRPIWTVALLSVLALRWWRSPKGSLGRVRKSKASLTLVMELRRVKRRRASLDTLELSDWALGS